MIRTKGGLSRLQRREAWFKIKASDKAVTKEDRREIKQVLGHLGRGAASGAKEMAGGKPVKASDGNSHLTEEQIERNLLRSRHRDESALRARQLYSKQYGGGIVQTVYRGAAWDEPPADDRRTKGTMTDLNIKRKSTGFAQEPNKDKSTDNPAPAAPPKGVRPIGL